MVAKEDGDGQVTLSWAVLTQALYAVSGPLAPFWVTWELWFWHSVSAQPRWSRMNSKWGQKSSCWACCTITIPNNILPSPSPGQASGLHHRAPGKSQLLGKYPGVPFHAANLRHKHPDSSMQTFPGQLSARHETRDEPQRCVTRKLPPLCFFSDFPKQSLPRKAITSRCIFLALNPALVRSDSSWPPTEKAKVVETRWR